MKCNCHPFQLSPSGETGRTGRKILEAAKQNILGGRAAEEGEQAIFDGLGDVVEDSWSSVIRNRRRTRESRVYYRGIAGVVHRAVTKGKVGRGFVNDVAAATMKGLTVPERKELSKLHTDFRAKLMEDPAFDVIPKDINTPLDAVSLLERGMSQTDVARLTPELEAAASLNSFVGSGFLGHTDIGFNKDFVQHGQRIINATAGALEERYGLEAAQELLDPRALSGERQILHPELTKTTREALEHIQNPENNDMLRPLLVNNMMDPKIVAQLDREIRANPRETFRILTERLDQPGALNMRNFVGAEGPARLIHGLQALAESANRFVDTTEGWTELEVRSYQRFMDILDPANRDAVQMHLLDSADEVQKGFRGARENAVVAQWAINHMGNHAVTQVRRYLQGTIGDEELGELAGTLRNLDKLRDIVTRFRSEAGRTLRSANLEVGTPEEVAPGALRRTFDLVIDAEGTEGAEGFRRTFDPRGAPTDEMAPSLKDAAAKRGLVDDADAIVAADDAALGPFENMDEFKKFITEELKPMLDSSSTDDEALQKLLAMNKVVRGPGGIGAIAREWRYGAMLSGPRTLVVNLIGSVATAYSRPMEMALGAAFTGDTTTIKKAMNEMMVLTQNLRDGMKFAKVAFAEGPQLNPKDAVEGYAKRGAINNNPEGPLGFAGEGLFGNMVNFIGEAVRTPGKVLQATDEWVKQAQYRTTFMSKTADQLMNGRNPMSPEDAWKQARVLLDQNVRDGQAYGPGVVYKQGMALAEEQGVPAGLRKKFAQDYLDRNYDSVLGDISKEAMKDAYDVTFQTPLRPGSVPKKLEEMSRSNWLVNLAIPFVRTPTNLLRTAAQHVDIIGPTRALASRWRNGGKFVAIKDTHNRFLQEMASGDPSKRAAALGRLSFGWGTMTMVGVAYGSGQITGGGPTDPKQRALMRETGWKPYSIRTSDGQYFSYERFDPLAGIMSLSADFFEYLNSAEENDEEIYQTGMSALMTSVARQLDNKSYLSGLTDMLSALGNDAESLPKAIGGLAGSFVPTIAADAVKAADPHEREMREWLDGIRKRIPALRPLTEGRQGLPIMRNMFGEPVSGAKNAAHNRLGEDSAAANWLGLVIPVAYSSVGDDGVDEELQLLGKGFSPPSGIKGGMDLRLMENSDGQSAYDRWQELQGTLKVSGMTLRDAVKELMKSEQYKAWTPESTEEVESPRIGAIRNLISRFRARAFSELQKEFPEIRRGLINRQQARAKTLLGVDVTL